MAPSVAAEHETRDGAAPPAEADGRRRPPRVPERTCIATRAQLAPGDLIRFVRAPDGTVTPDLADKLPGRGAWVALARDAVEKAVRERAFARSFRQPVIIPDGIADAVERLLVARAVQALALANKSGLVVAGFAKVEAAIDKGRIAALLHAREAARDGVAKLDGRLARRLAERDGKARDAAGAAALVVTELASSDLSLALGRENVVHAALIEGGAARYFISEIERLTRYRSSPSAAAGRPPHETSNTEQA